MHSDRPTAGTMKRTMFLAKGSLFGAYDAWPTARPLY
jgi:hypothetical protein